MTLDKIPAKRQSAAFLWLYALAWAGGSIAYVPFLTILLPIRVSLMTGAQRVHWIAYITFFGAVAASIGGVGFGWLSDRSGVRRPWIVAGLIGTIVLMLCVPLAKEPLQLLFLIIAWQLALNMMLGPLSAWAADIIPPNQLGFLGGLLALSPALGSVAGAIVTIPGLAGPDGRLLLVALLVAGGVMPLLTVGRPRTKMPAEVTDSAAPPVENQKPVAAAMWLARFLVQISEATLFAYLYYYFRSLDPTRDAGWIARLFGIVLCTAVPVALLIGRWSDRNGRPLFPLIAAALTLGCALIGMALASTPAQATAGYVLFGFATTVFLSLHSAQTLRVLRSPTHRGRDLGLFNLTNTFPSLIMPWLTLAIVPTFGYSWLFVLLSVLALLAASILFLVSRRTAAAAHRLD